MSANARPVLRHVPISDIVERDRHRKDLGELLDLCRSIEAVGLLHPVVIDENNRLIAGSRRIAAFIRLDRETIPALVVKNLSDATALLRAERDENVCRKDFTPSEAVALGRALEKLERPKAKERQRQHGGTAPGRHKNTSENVSEVSTDETQRVRHIVGGAVGMSGPTYQRAKAVVEAAEKNPAKYGPLVEEMDRTGKVRGAYNKVAGTKPPKKKKKASTPATFREDDFPGLCERLNAWLQWRSDRAGGLEAHAECADLLAKLQRRVEKWQRQKPL